MNTTTHYAANEDRFPKFRVTGEKYVDCGRVGVIGNDFGDHITLHFPNGECANFDRDAVEELVWHDTCNEHPDNFSQVDVMDSGMRYSGGYRVHDKALYQDGVHLGFLATCRKWRYSF